MTGKSQLNVNWGRFSWFSFCLGIDFRFRRFSVSFASSGNVVFCCLLWVKMGLEILFARNGEIHIKITSIFRVSWPTSMVWREFFRVHAAPRRFHVSTNKPNHEKLMRFSREIHVISFSDYLQRPSTSANPKILNWNFFSQITFILIKILHNTSPKQFIIFNKKICELFYFFPLLFNVGYWPLHEMWNGMA